MCDRCIEERTAMLVAAFEESEDKTLNLLAPFFDAATAAIVAAKADPGPTATRHALSAAMLRLVLRNRTRPEGLTGLLGLLQTFGLLVSVVGSTLEFTVGLTAGAFPDSDLRLVARAIGDDRLAELEAGVRGDDPGAAEKIAATRQLVAAIPVPPGVG